MNSSVNFIHKNFSQFSVFFKLRNKYFSSISITKNILKRNNYSYQLKLKNSSLVFIRQIKSFRGNSSSFKKEKIDYNGLRRLLSLAAPEKYKLMGKQYNLLAKLFVILFIHLSIYIDIFNLLLLLT